MNTHSNHTGNKNKFFTFIVAFLLASSIFTGGMFFIDYIFGADLSLRVKFGSGFFLGFAMSVGTLFNDEANSKN